MSHKKSVWAEMSPIRKKLIKIFLPIWLPIASAFIIGIFVWMAVGKEEQVPFMLLYCVFTLSFALLPLCFLPLLNRKGKQPLANVFQRALIKFIAVNFFRVIRL